MQNERVTQSTGRLAPLAQVALAALVAGSLLTFSTIAFRTAFDEPSRSGGVEVSSPRTEPAAPVVLPTPPREEAVTNAEETSDVVAEVVAPATGNGDLDESSDSDDALVPDDKDKKDKNDGSEPRVALPWPGNSRTLSGVDSDDKGEHDKNKGHGKSKAHGKSKGDGKGHKDRGRGHEGHDHKGKGKGHSKHGRH